MIKSTQLNERAAANQQAMIEQQLAAQRSAKAGNFSRAVEQYAVLIQMLTYSKKNTSPMALADAYRDYATANHALASTLDDVDSEKAQLCRQQAVLQLQQALLYYPKEARQSLKSCHQQLTVITKAVTHLHQDQDQDQDQNSFVDIMDVQKKEPVLHWRKALLKRFNAARAQAIKEIALVTTDSDSLIPQASCGIKK